MTADPFELSRAQFMAGAAAPNVPANVLKLGYVIAYKRMDVESKTAVVSQKTLAADLNMTVRSVQNLLPMLETFGLVIEPAGGPGKPSVYRVKSLASESVRPKAASPIGVKASESSRRRLAARPGAPLSISAVPIRLILRSASPKLLTAVRGLPP
jgi:hypothetical protein